MKKTILITGLILALSIQVQAQLVKFGAKAGLNYANVTGTVAQTDAITSYHAGFVAEIKVIDKFAVQPELLYTTQGYSYKNAGNDIKNELGYLAIPVMAKIYMAKTLSLELGPQASFLLSEKNKFNAKDSNSFDFSVAGGLGFKITDMFFIQTRYVLGLTEISADAKSKNAVVQLSAGIMF